ncbi:hypothetical protein [Nocardia testacea]|uniref:hypothetical protein n=1 Tax=Nocardia testacea TaxID=248551 RepID=UPI0033F09D68
MSIRARARAWWSALVSRTPQLISTRTDPWAVEWVITDALTYGFSMGVAGAPDPELAYQRAKDHRETLTHHLGDTAHPIGEGR